jgi:Tfp pilus assembly protein PilV
MHRPAARCPRRGLTVIEVLVALILVTVGLLGFAATSALALRSTTMAAREHDALTRLDGRMALLGAAGCERAVSGDTSFDSAGVRERWTVGAVRNGAATVALTVEWVDPRGPHTLSLRSALLC